MAPRGVLYAEWEAVIAALVYGVEAAAWVSLVICVAMLTLRGGVSVLRLWWHV